MRTIKIGSFHPIISSGEHSKNLWETTTGLASFGWRKWLGSFYDNNPPAMRHVSGKSLKITMDLQLVFWSPPYGCPIEWPLHISLLNWTMPHHGFWAFTWRCLRKTTPWLRIFRSKLTKFSGFESSNSTNMHYFNSKAKKRCKQPIETPVSTGCKPHLYCFLSFAPEKNHKRDDKLSMYGICTHINGLHVLMYGM